jgi:hypothetical protein
MTTRSSLARVICGPQVSNTAALPQTNSPTEAGQDAPEGSRALCSVLQSHPDPLFVIDLQRTLWFRNRAATRLMRADDGFRSVLGRLSTGCAASDRRLNELLQDIHNQVDPNPFNARGLRLHRRGADGCRLLVVHPLGRCSPDGLSGVLFLLHIPSPRRPSGAFDPLLRDLFGLSTAEITAALAVIRMGGVDNAATSLYLSRETVRTQLKAVYRKCDIRSSAQLADLIHSVTLFCGPHGPGDPDREPG